MTLLPESRADIDEVVELFVFFIAEAAYRGDEVVHIVQVIKQIVVASDCSNVSSQVKSLPEDNAFGFILVLSWVEIFGLAAVCTQSPFFVPSLS